MDSETHYTLNEILNLIIASKLKDEQGYYWETINYNRLTKCYDKIVGDSIYAGNAGIILFLSEAYLFFKHQEILDVILKAANWLIHFCENNSANNYGFYSGRGGVSYVLTKVYKITGDNYLLAQARRVMKDCDTDNQFHWMENKDVISGTGGAILALLNLYSITEDIKIVKQIEFFTNDLIENHCLSANGSIYWEKSKIYMAGLCGFAHGVSGMLWVLTELYKFFGNPDIKYLIDKAYLYEDQLFDKSHDNWPDFRSEDTSEYSESLSESGYRAQMSKLNEPGLMIAWCHGAAGIGMCRLKMYEFFRDKKYLKDATIALNATIASISKIKNNYSNYTLCHAVGGNAYLLRQFVEMFPNTYQEELIENIAIAASSQAKRIGVLGLVAPTALPENNLGLFNGLAGVGYFYLISLRKESKMMDILIPESPSPVKRFNLELSNIRDKMFSKAFPKTIALIKHVGNHIYALRSLEIEQVNKHPSFFVKKMIKDLYRLKSHDLKNKLIKAVFDFELSKHQFLSDCNDYNNFIFEYQRYVERRNLSFLGNKILNDCIDENVILRLNPYCKIYKSNWNINQIDVPLHLPSKNLKGKSHFLFEIHSVYEVIHFEISSLAYYIIMVFDGRNNMNEGFRKFCDLFQQNGAQENHKLKNLFTQQVVELLKRRLLVVI
ncbi:lanthionine synthetase LanC family protein [Mucilaginibacter sp. KACC 22063]|uniref:lanthionine synthetase LanC family protein n=1 Tax=Mucilaginibacter sp. KACC 22063 TaxID=3025666 RepID=UPI002365CCEC|nr:lanthionine synthetase LanC family protein [Mucilaginibacter sp. KACC 22063]WDF55247.1 glycoside hydrolase family 127 protein [Mucilaginibacter sp. KACC 22063]